MTQIIEDTDAREREEARRRVYEQMRFRPAPAPIFVMAVTRTACGASLVRRAMK